MIKKMSFKNLSNNTFTNITRSAAGFVLVSGVIIGSLSPLTVFASEGIQEEMPAEIISDETFEYRVMFIDYDGTELYNEQMPEGSGIVEPVVPERIGFTFVGWAPEVDPVVPAQDVVYTAQYFQVEDVLGEDGMGTSDATVVYDSAMDETAGGVTGVETKGNSMACTGQGHIMNFIFMLILFLMETAWLQDRRSQQMRRYDTLMDQVDKE